MKNKLIAFCLVMILTMGLVAVSFAISTTGPSQTVSGASKSKATTSADPTLTIDSFSIGGAGYYIFWIRHNATDSQVTPTYYFSSEGAKSIFYMIKSRDAGKVVAGNYYTTRYKSNSAVPAGGAGSITESNYNP